MIHDSITHEGRAPQGPRLFRAELTPHRSLRNGQFRALMTVLAAAIAGADAAFLSVGAWPVVVFLALSALLTYGAFRLNYRSGRLYELVDLTADSLTLTRVPPSGRATSVRFNPYWVRFDLARAPDGRHQLSLSSHGRSLTFGAFLSDEEKRDFADAFARELARCRGRQG